MPQITPDSEYAKTGRTQPGRYLLDGEVEVSRTTPRMTSDGKKVFLSLVVDSVEPGLPRASMRVVVDGVFAGMEYILLFRKKAEEAFAFRREFMQMPDRALSLEDIERVLNAVDSAIQRTYY
jgi:hypothetical protein